LDLIECRTTTRRPSPLPDHPPTKPFLGLSGCPKSRIAGRSSQVRLVEQKGRYYLPGFGFINDATIKVRRDVRHNVRRNLSKFFLMTLYGEAVEGLHDCVWRLHHTVVSAICNLDVISGTEFRQSGPSLMIVECIGEPAVNRDHWAHGFGRSKVAQCIRR